jgi:hypothetical protein
LSFGSDLLSSVGPSGVPILILAAFDERIQRCERL